jgi:uracil-DNA glycosylase
MSYQNFIPFVLESSWQKVLKQELQEPYILDLAAFVEKEYTTSTSPIYPPQDLIFNAFTQTPYDKVQVVIMGQDPYHGPGQAHGLSFSVPKGIKPPPSLQNIFKELHSDIHLSTPTHGCLLNWAKQGVLLLNATLTVKQSEPMSHHGRGWERLTDAIIVQLIKREDPIIFVLWGKSAQDKCRFVNESANLKHHYILTAAHPSPFSAANGFFGCRHFSKINMLLEQQGKQPIDWSLKE